MSQIYESQGSLTFSKGEFLLAGKPFRIISGAIHYFRTFPQNWNDRLQKMKACGLNTIETYVPWNLHEENPGEFNFSGILDVRQFLQQAHQLGLYVIFRPGPYICSEWDFGGLPAWLLSDPDMKVRSNYEGYLNASRRYFNELLPKIVDLQYSRGGPIIAFQIENEFGSYSGDVTHLHEIKKMYIEHGLQELFLTSDNVAGLTVDVFYQHALPTANFKDIKEGRQLFEQIRKWSPEFPLMVTEFWTGWFDHWTSAHDGLDVQDYAYYLMEILKTGASVNFYMFHGGTNFGFMNGANQESTYKPDVTSYDYDALLTEKGDITPKYLKTRELLMKYIYGPQGITLPDIPGDSRVKAYGNRTASGYIRFETFLSSVKSVELERPVPMEMLQTNGEYGQNFGFTLYRANVPHTSAVMAFANLPADRAQIFVNGTLVATLGWKDKNQALRLPKQEHTEGSVRLDILVENHGRVNYGTEELGVLNNQRKGIIGEMTIDGQLLKNVTAFVLDFKNKFSDSNDFGGTDDVKVPGIFKTTLNITDEPSDTFLFMKGWGKGVVLVNDFNIGRYWSAGPQQTLYLPGSLLRKGDNQIVWFEQERIGQDIIFTDRPILDVNNQSTITLD
ncbi:beta-galactosidase-1-like protein 2 isoform X2 [Mya arenaria]|uniref:beta-galactosidase-1-like protein 2 isoform X2 n=1 Tax=Mya arenaria TaxID=6604 RepID=UPI0022E62646|nr:beta-galactosidase-1-like protein 2 isoform X2 [Mya arenaria]